MSKYLREFYHSVRMTTSISFTKSTISASFASFIFEFVLDILSWSSFLCICLDANDSRTQDLRTLYHEHTNSNFISVSRCSWFTQAKKAQENYLMRKHELQMKNKVKQKAKKLLKQQKEVRLIKKRVEEYTCRRCKNSTKFDSNIKLHEHIRTRHAKKSKSVISSAFESKSSTSSRSVIFSSFTSSKLLSLSMFASEIVRERSESTSSTSSKLIVMSLATSSSEFSSIATSRKSIFWAEIVSRSMIASKFSRFSIATSKSIYNILKKLAVCCSFVSLTSSQASTSSRFYFIVNDLYHMFVEKSNSFGLQSSQNKSLSSRSLGKCNSKSNCKFDFIQSRITSYFHAMILFAFKSIKFEAFESTHARENLSRQFSIFHSISSISFSFRFSRISRSPFVCRHCQERFVIYWFIDWIMSNVSKVENNEILKEMRYWRFVSFHSVLKEYWFLLEKIITLGKLEHVVCLLFCSLALSINRWSIWRNFKSLYVLFYCLTNMIEIYLCDFVLI